MNKSLIILHCANFSNFKNGEVYYSMDRKISHGLIKNGHLVYDFSYRDIAKAQRFLGFKKKSIQKMNNDLVNTCKNLKPNILLLGKCELITEKTLSKIKKNSPNIKIIQWYVDFIKTESEMFLSKFKYIDLFLQSSATELKDLSEKYEETIFAYLPNISDPSFDKNFNFEKEYDILYIARDNKEDNRYKFAKLLNDYCEDKNINLKMYGSLGNPLIFGSKYYEEISKSKIAINFNREDKLETFNKVKILGSSDRMNHFMGAGTCTFSPKIIDLDKLYINNEEIIYFENIQDCFEKLSKALESKSYELIGKKGQEKAYQLSNAKRITKYILELGIHQKVVENYEWKEYIYKNAKKLFI